MPSHGATKETSYLIPARDDEKWGVLYEEKFQVLSEACGRNWVQQKAVRGFIWWVQRGRRSDPGPEEAESERDEEEVPHVCRQTVTRSTRIFLHCFVRSACLLCATFCNTQNVCATHILGLLGLKRQSLHVGFGRLRNTVWSRQGVCVYVCVWRCWKVQEPTTPGEWVCCNGSWWSNKIGRWEEDQTPPSSSPRLNTEKP